MSADAVHRGGLTEDTLADALVEFVDDNGLRASKLVCGERAQLAAKRILTPPGFSGVATTGIEVDPYMDLDDWKLA